MSSDTSFTPPSENGAPGGVSAITPVPPPAGLPPVAPPSGKLMLQLFLVPGLIVVVLVAVALTWRWLFGAPASKTDFLDKLHNDNTEIRWRAAEQLAQVLPRDDALASDADFARQLGLMLLETRDRSRQAEKDFLDFQTSIDKQRELTEPQRKEKVDAARTKVEADRTFISILTASLGDFLVPVVAPVLKELAKEKEGLDLKALVQRRRQAVWALANLGENLKRFDALSGQQKDSVLEQTRVALWDAARPVGNREDFLKLSAEDKDAVLAKLDLATDAARSAHADWLRDALRALRQRVQGQSDDLGVGDVLIACSEDPDDPYLRELSAFAMNFWRGDEAANARMEKRLVDLTYDDGQGRETSSDLGDEKDGNATVAVSNPRGLQIQYNAAVALARFGSKDARLDMLKDMLDENRLKKEFVLRSRERDRNGDASADKPNDEVIGQTLNNTLKAVAELHALRPKMDLSSLKPAVDALASGSGNLAVRIEAEKTRLALSK